MANKINFTKAALGRITPPVKTEGKSGGVFVAYYDDGGSYSEKGLVLLVSNGGAKSFYLYKRINGKPQRIKLGSFPDMTVENARKKARSYKVMIEDGKDPHAEAQRKRTEGSLLTFFEKEYIERHAKKHNKTWQQDSKNFRRHAKPLYNKTLAEITRAQVEAMHNAVAKQSGH